MKIEIKNRWNDSIIFSHEVENNTMKITLEAFRIKFQANLSEANLSKANLSKADLSKANLSLIKSDFFSVLLVAKNEVEGLKKALIDGNVDGSTYTGECCCLVGTIANVKSCNYEKIEGLIPNSSRPAERWFLGIRKGDTPENNPLSKITIDWIEEFLIHMNK